MVCIPTENHGEAGEVDYIEVSGLPYDYTKEGKDVVFGCVKAEVESPAR